MKEIRNQQFLLFIFGQNWLLGRKESKKNESNQISSRNDL